MITNVSFTVPGEPQGKGRARVGKIGGHARMFTPAKTVSYEGLIAMAAQEAMAGSAPLDGPLMVSIDVIHSVPASWSQKKRKDALAGSIHPTVKPDFDNIAKCVGDGGNGVLWVDDKQIVSAMVRKHYGERPGLHVQVATL